MRVRYKARSIKNPRSRFFKEFIWILQCYKERCVVWVSSIKNVWHLLPLIRSRARAGLSSHYIHIYTHMPFASRIQYSKSIICTQIFLAYHIYRFISHLEKESGQTQVWSISNPGPSITRSSVTGELFSFFKRSLSMNHALTFYPFDFSVGCQKVQEWKWKENIRMATWPAVWSEGNSE